MICMIQVIIGASFGTRIQHPRKRLITNPLFGSEKIDRQGATGCVAGNSYSRKPHAGCRREPKRTLDATQSTGNRPETGRIAERKWESADKPGFVVDNHSSRTCVTTDLQRPTRTQRGPRLKGSLFGLAPGGVYHRRGMLPPTRCALTAPFQPYRRPKTLRRYTFCCTFRRLAPPRRYLAPCPPEPGLSSPAHAQQRLSGRLPARSITAVPPRASA